MLVNQDVTKLTSLGSSFNNAAEFSLLLSCGSVSAGVLQPKSPFSRGQSACLLSRRTSLFVDYPWWFGQAVTYMWTPWSKHAP